MRKFFQAYFDLVRDMPSTQVQISVGVALAIVYVLGSMLGSFIIGVSIATAAPGQVPLNILPTQQVHENIGQFILIFSGLGVGQYIGKRATQHKPGETAPAGEAGA